MKRSLLLVCLQCLLQGIYAEEPPYHQDLNILEIGVANDLFQGYTKSDKYYSASFQLAYSSQAFKTKWAPKILLGNDEQKDWYGFSIRQEGYTPENLWQSSIDTSDHPYAGTLILDYWRKNAQLSPRWNFYSAISIGFSGEESGAQETQTFIHKQTGSTLPQGWDNQIGTAIILQYALQSEYCIESKQSFLRTGFGGEANLGTFYNRISAFAHGQVSLWGTPGTNLDRRRTKHNKFECYLDLYMKGQYTIYDGSLQGGLWALSDSPYTLSHNEYKHLIPVVSHALTLSYKGIKLSYTNVVEMDYLMRDDFFSYGAFDLIITLLN